MQEVIRFALLGFGLGALYALAASGLIATYRGSGVLNFAQGAMGMMGAFVFYEIRERHGAPFVMALVAGIAVSALMGALTYVVVMRPLRRASSLARIVATLGVLIILEGLATVRYGTTPLVVRSDLPTSLVHLGGIVVSVDRFILFGLAGVLAVALWAVYRFTPFGLATNAVAESERAASTLGLSPRMIACANWMIGAGLSGLAAILVTPIISLAPGEMTTLVLAAMGAALIASFRSFPIACLAGMILGIAQTEMTRFVSTPGLAASLPFIFVVAVLIFTGRSLPLRDFFLQRLPRVGTGQIRLSLVLPGLVVMSILILSLSVTWTDAVIATLVAAVTLLSTVVLTGYAGQISLAQVAIGGVGALIAGRLSQSGWPFVPALLVGVIGTIPLGALFAIPAVRTRGLNLAIVTLGLGTAIELMIFDNATFTGVTGAPLTTPSLFGWSIDPIAYPKRYAFVVLVGFGLVALMVANLRRSRTGRRLLAVRENERASAALGIRVPTVKLYAFSVSAGIAAFGGILAGFHFFTIVYSTQYANVNSINFTGWSFLGGIGYNFGSFLGALFAPGTLGTQVGSVVFANFENWVQVIGGVALIAILLANQDGQVGEIVKQFAALGRRPRVARPLSRLPFKRQSIPPLNASAEHSNVPARHLEVSGLTVKYGNVVAVDDVSLVVRPRQVLGLIGPNGAGKTTLIDAITGFVQPSAGAVILDGQDVTKWSATRRSRAGFSRSFQALELFEDLTVLDNLRVASDPRDRVSYIRDLVWPKLPALPGPVVAAIAEFRLEDDLLRRVQDLSYGQRRLLAIARAVATEPSVLLLDEPAAGLTEIETRELVHLVRRLADSWGMAVLLVEHDVNFVMSVCDEIVVLDFGSKISHGAPEQVRTDPVVIKAYLGGSEETDNEPARIGVVAEMVEP